MKLLRLLPMAAFFAAIITITSGCAGPKPQTMAFSSSTALKENSRSFDLSPTQVMNATKRVFVTQGFTIESADINSGLVKATRHFQDPKDDEVSYNIFASAFLMENSPESTTLTLSASSQTVLHREWTTWWKLLWILPLIPTGTEYQTIITKEGNIVEPKLYSDFFTAVGSVGSALKGAEKAAAAKAAAEAAAKAEADKAATERAAAEAATKAEAKKAAAEEAAMKAEAGRVASEIAVAEAAAKPAAETEVAVADTVAGGVLPEASAPPQ